MNQVRLRLWIDAAQPTKVPQYNSNERLIRRFLIDFR